MNSPLLGTYHALLPYTRERYFENHKVMSAVDKLHKLYSTTAEPVVWARTVGVEVLNEMDTIKAAIMTLAGSTTTKSTKDQALDLGLSAFQGVTTGLRGLSALSGSIGGLVSNSLAQLSQKLLNRKT
jgi:ubiquinone biosynthesis monooxygenase Coq6